MICQCEECGKYCVEDEILQKQTTYEEVYGVRDMFGNTTPTFVDMCPNCHATNCMIDVDEFEIVGLLNEKKR